MSPDINSDTSRSFLALLFGLLKLLAAANIGWENKDLSWYYLLDKSIWVKGDIDFLYIQFHTVLSAKVKALQNMFVHLFMSFLIHPSPECPRRLENT